MSHPYPPSAPYSPSNYYRLYTFDSDDHVIDVRDFEAANDLAAIIEAGVAQSELKRELWNEGRRVLEFSGLPSSE